MARKQPRRTTARRLPRSVKRTTSQGPEAFWRSFTALWTGIAIVVFVFDAVTIQSHHAVNAAVGAIYVAVLALFVGTKEFERWYDHQRQRHHGEIYVYIWTSLMIVFTFFASLPTHLFSLPRHVVPVYIAVLGIFAITQRSKTLHQRRLARK